MWSDDLELNRLQPGYGPGQGVAGYHCAHSLRRAGVNQVTRLQFPRIGQVLNGLCNTPDQFRDLAALAILAIDLQ